VFHRGELGVRGALGDIEAELVADLRNEAKGLRERERERGREIH
jgi:hypothetical protein